MGSILDVVKGKSSPGEGAPAPAPSGRNDKAVAAADKAKAALQRRGPGRPPKSPEHAADPSAAAAQAQLSEEVGRLFDLENWKPIVRAPADIRLAMTGRDHWRLTPKEETVLATTASTAARYFLAVDPKWIAITLCLFNFATIYGSRVALDVQANRKERAERAERGRGDRGAEVSKERA